MGKSIRVHVTIPADLKKRMDKANDLVNWSKVAREAFEQRLAEIVKQKGRASMSEAIARLRASKAEHGSQLYRDGQDAGERWAKSRADFDELTLLSDLREQAQPRGEWEGCFTDDPLVSAAYSAAERFVFVIRPDEDGDRGFAYEFWSRIVDGEMPAAEFVFGFANAALVFFDEVRDQL
jgi:hypothetical protein